MSIDDIWILTLSLGSAIGGVIAIHATFRHAGPTRDAVITPPVFAVVGGLIGISIGMIWLSDTAGNVKLETGVPLLIGGLFFGAVAGAGLKAIYSRMGRGKAVVFILVVTILAGRIGAPIGWVAGFITEFGYREQVSVSRMMWGAIIGAGVGFLLGLSEVLFRRRGAT